MTSFTDNFAGTAAGPLHGRVSTSGHVWDDRNNGLKLDGSGHMIRNLATEGVGGAYGAVDLDAPVTSMKAQVSWSGSSDSPTENGSFVMIASDSPQRAGVAPSAGIFTNGLHPVFGIRQLAFDLWQNNSGVNMLNYTYPGGPLKTDGTVYECGWEITGIIMTFYCPDGSVRKLAHPLFKQYAGKHLIYQVYRGAAVNLYPEYRTVTATTDPIPGYTPPPPLPAVLTPGPNC